MFLRKSIDYGVSYKNVSKSSGYQIATIIHMSAVVMFCNQHVSSPCVLSEVGLVTIPTN